MLTQLTALAGDPRFIPGVYNYCDQWCAHCPVTGRCLVFAAERLRQARLAGTDGEPAGPVAGQADQDFELSDTSAGAAVPEVDGTDESGAGGTPIDPCLPEEGHPLEFLARHYTRQAAGFLASLTLPTPSDDPPSSFEVISWFHLLIPAKIHRALVSHQHTGIDDPELLVDALGSAKVALVGIDRSLAAWPDVAGCACDARTSGLIELLEALRTGLEIRFPGARTFVRPGLDDQAGRSC